MDNRTSGVIYFLLGLYSLMISWHYYHNWIYLLIHYIFWPIFLVYQLLIGHLSHDLWRTIPESYFK